MMYEPEKSDSVVVAVKRANKTERSVAEPVEPRTGTKGNANQQSTRRAQDRESVSQALERVRLAARRGKKEKFTSLLHHVDPEMLRTSFYALKRDAAPGIDGMTWDTYEQGLDRRIEDLHARVQSGAYRALPSRRSYIPKEDGTRRPLAVTALEDKIVQRAVAAVLSEIYEEDFLGFSYGFRPGRGQHDALDALCVGISGKKVNFILDADIRSFFTEVSQEWVVRFLEHRIGDKRILRLVQKWLRAGVLEDEVVTIEEKGTGQGSVISPLLANVYLHYVFDLWAERWRRREATGDMIMVRYADDIVVGFQHEADARRFWDDMRERLRAFSLTLHPEKTRLIEFGRFAAQNRERRGTRRVAPSSPDGAGGQSTGSLSGVGIRQRLPWRTSGRCRRCRPTVSLSASSNRVRNSPPGWLQTQQRRGGLPAFRSISATSAGLGPRQSKSCRSH